MNIPCRFIRHLLLAVATMITATSHAQVPQLINYQGRVAVGSENFDGTGQFKFALVNANGSTTYWSNNGTSTAGSQPTAAVTLTVTKGLYSVLLGDTALTNMTAIPASVFTNADVRLRVWFNDGVNGFQLLTPDQRIAAVGYAIMAGTVADGSITSTKIASGAVGSSQLATGGVQTVNIAIGAVGASQLADGTITAAKMADGAITPNKPAKPARSGSVSSSSLLMDPTGGSFTVPFITAFGSVPNVTLTMDAAPLTVPTKAYLALTGRAAGQFTARVSNGTSASLTSLLKTQASPDLSNSNEHSLAVVNGNPAISFRIYSSGRLGYVRANDINGTT